MCLFYFVILEYGRNLQDFFMMNKIWGIYLVNEVGCLKDFLMVMVQMSGFVMLSGVFVI